MQIFQLPDLSVELILLVYLIDVRDDLPVNLHQRMVGLNKIMLHIATGLGHVRVIGHDEKSMLIIHQLFALAYHGTNAMTLLVQILQFLLFDDIIRLLLIGMIHITLQIHHIFQGSEAGLLEKLPDIILISRFTAGIVLLQKIADILLQRIDTLLHTQHADLLVDIQHLFEKVQVVTLNLYHVASFHQHTIVNQLPQPGFISSDKVNSKCDRKPHEFPFLKHLTEQPLLT